MKQKTKKLHGNSYIPDAKNYMLDEILLKNQLNKLSLPPIKINHQFFSKN